MRPLLTLVLSLLLTCPLLASTSVISGYADADPNPQTPGWHKLVYHYDHDGEPQQFSFLLYLPEGFAPSADTNYGVMIFMSGLGERGSDPQMLFSSGIAHTMVRRPDLHKTFPHILLGPQCPSNARYEDEKIGRGIANLLEEIISRYPVDESRLYMTGFSMGGTACWSVARYAPDRFAAIAPMVPRVFQPDVVSAAMKGSDTTCLIVSGEIDTKSEPGSTEMATALRAAGVDVVHAMIPLGDHNLWGWYFRDERFYNWLLSHQKGQPKPADRLDEPTLVAMAAQRTAYNEKWLTKLAADLQEFAPWWHIDNCSDRAKPGLHAKLAGKERVFVTHPWYYEVPCRLQTTTTLPSAKKVTLKLVVGRHEQGDWKLLVRVNEEEVFARVVNDKSAPDQWMSVDVELSKWAGQEVRLQLCNMGHGTFRNDQAYWHKIEITQGP